MPGTSLYIHRYIYIHIYVYIYIYLYTEIQHQVVFKWVCQKKKQVPMVHHDSPQENSPSAVVVIFRYTYMCRALAAIRRSMPEK